MVDVRDRRPEPALGRRSAGKSASQLVARRPVRQKNTAVPSGAATADRSASAGPRVRGSTGASSAVRAPPRRPDRVGRLDAERGDGRAVRGRVSALSSTRASPCCHSCTGLLRCVPGVAEPERGEGARDGGARQLVVHGQLGEREPVQLRGGRRVLGAAASRRTQVGRAGRRSPRQRQQRAQGVDRGAAGVGLAEDVVEHLERQRPGVARGQHVAEEGGQVEGALAGEEPVVAAPLQHVHVHVRGVGQLQEEQLLAGDVARCPPGREPRDRMWKLSTHSPSAGWSARRTMSHDRS